MSGAEFGIDRAIQTGSRLAGQAVAAANPARPGGNNRVFCLGMADGSRLALKYYPAQQVDRRDRLGQEYEALSFLAQHGVKLTPRPLASDRAENARCINGSTAKPPCCGRNPTTSINWRIF